MFNPTIIQSHENRTSIPGNTHMQGSTDSYGKVYQDWQRQKNEIRSGQEQLLVSVDSERLGLMNMHASFGSE